MITIRITSRRKHPLQHGEHLLHRPAGQPSETPDHSHAVHGPQLIHDNIARAVPETARNPKRIRVAASGHWRYKEGSQVIVELVR